MITRTLYLLAKVADFAVNMVDLFIWVFCFCVLIVVHILTFWSVMLTRQCHPILRPRPRYQSHKTKTKT